MMVGSEAGEVVAVVQIAMLANLPYPKAPRRRHHAPDDRWRARTSSVEQVIPITLARATNSPTDVLPTPALLTSRTPSSCVRRSTSRIRRHISGRLRGRRRNAPQLWHLSSTAPPT